MDRARLVWVLGGVGLALSGCVVCGCLGLARWGAERVWSHDAWGGAGDGAFAPQDAQTSDKRGPREAQESGGTVVLRDFRGVELRADAKHVFWTEVGVKEHRDEPAYITRAAVKRLRHAASPGASSSVETLFDFKRDGTRCTPHRLMFLRDRVGWFGNREWVDGPFDADRFMLRGAWSLHETLLPGSYQRTTTDGRDVLAVVLDRSARPELLRVEPRGGRREVVDVALDGLGFRRFSGASVLGATPTYLFGIASMKDRTTRVWRLDMRSGAQATLHTFPRGVEPRSVAFEDGRVALSWGTYGEPYTTVVIDGVTQRERLRIETRADMMRLSGERLYFAAEGAIQRVDLGSRAREVVVTTAYESGRCSTITASKLAVGGGFVYWIKDGALHRHPS